MKETGTRIQKVLSDGGILSRRKAEEYIKAGRITVNGHPAQIGHPVNPARDIIAIDGQRVQFARKKSNLYIMLNKPRGYVTTMSDELGRRCVAELVENAPQRVYPVGRLDKDTTGLLLLTDDGTFAHKVISPKSHVSKLYEAVVDGTPCEADFAAFREGIVLRDGTQCLPAELIDLGGGRVQVEVFEGKYHQVKRMLGSRQMSVLQLKRLRIGGLWLDGSLAEGEYRRLTLEEIEKIRPDILSK